MNNDFPTEQWRDVVGYEGLYQVSNHGRVMDVIDNRLLLGHLSAGGYHVVHFKGAANQRRSHLVHLLVARAFIGECPDGMEIDHIDTVKSNNHVSNLEYVTHLENVRRAVKNGLMGKLSDEKAEQIRAAYVPYITTYADLANRFNVSEATVRSIIKGKTWRTETTTADSSHPFQKLSPEDCEHIKQWRKLGFKIYQIAEAYDVSDALISQIVNGKRRKSPTAPDSGARGTESGVRS
jgi:plasmid maintenance system antidote protein VapI